MDALDAPIDSVDDAFSHALDEQELAQLGFYLDRIRASLNILGG